ncbi:MAG: hypothetical protein QNJ71_06140 [Acidimicrobiia bacterium]|nr:hypothetical protein [Acidimicrobiia bacterium]
MTGRFLALAVATLVWSLSLWFGFLAFGTSRAIALAIMAIGLAFSLYAIAGFSGADDIGTTGFRATLIGLGVIALLFVSFWGSGIDTFVVAAPIVGGGFGGAYALTPADQPSRLLTRCAVVVVAAGIASWVYWVDPTVYGLIAPLVTFGPLAIADRIHDRAREILAETPSD